MPTLPSPNFVEAYAKLIIKEKERKRDRRLALEGASPRVKRLSSQASALIALIVVVLIIVGLIVLFHVL